MLAPSILLPNAELDWACPINWEHPLNAGLAADYSVVGAGGLRLRNLTGAMRSDGTIVAGPEWMRDGLRFTGTGRVNIGDAPALKISGSAITLVAHIWDNGTVRPSGNVMGKVTGTFNYLLFLNQGNQSIDFNISTGANTVVSLPGGIGGLNRMKGRWNVIVGVYDGANMTLYLNGKSLGSTAKTGNIASNTDGFAIGDRGTTANVPFSGIMNGWRVYSRAFSAGDVASLTTEYQTGKPNIWNWNQGFESLVGIMSTGNRRRRVLCGGAV